MPVDLLSEVGDVGLEGVELLGQALLLMLAVDNLGHLLLMADEPGYDGYEYATTYRDHRYPWDGEIENMLGNQRGVHPSVR
ncbi:MAG: hypothetical protein IH851_10630 [Armatimonadetes bacterium]|nr:hypothetical protein [Armatimonadota bacterium]